MIHFRECPDAGYKPRTIENASADATIAFAIDFYTSGEILTQKSALEQGKLYIPIRYPFTNIEGDTNYIVHLFNNKKVETLNIAGNGIYTMSKLGTIFNQYELDNATYEFLNKIVNHPKLENKITVIRSGGQTGFDEAGIKAAEKLGIDSLVYAPKGWRFRGMDGDIADETKFKERFGV
jgi:hypothetical protein